jgi:acetyltransferase-like isoleucine patch superfamily enzyme
MSSLHDGALRRRWISFWLARGGLSRGGRLATRLASWGAPKYKGKRPLAQMSRRGYISPHSQIACQDLRLGNHCYIDDDVVIFDRGDGGHVALGDGVHLYKGSIIEVGQGGCVEIGAGSHIQPNCQFTAFVGAVRIGRDVQVAPASAFYPYEHSIAAGQAIHKQPLHTRGDIVIGDGAWLGYGVIVLDGVTIGPGAVIGAGAVVTRDVAANTIAAGVPAKVLGPRPETE